MSSQALQQTLPRTARTAPIPFARVILVELRKQTDTRAGFGLLAAITILTGIGVVTQLWILEPPALTWENFAAGASIGWGLLLPLIGILAVTGEWSQRSALTTFSLEPRRARVSMAKLVSSLLLGAAMFLATYAIAAIVNVVGIFAFDGDGSWRLDANLLAVMAATLIIYVSMGVAFGMLFLNTPLAIVSYLVLPNVFTFLMLFDGLREAVQWIDVASALMPMLEGTMVGLDWAHLATAVSLWVVLPFVAGLWRVSRREVA
ncbi:ABC transporter permease [Microbacterium amylolyticum]|uniref:ABC-type transport system involved in multi-copper enzyme maturation permease subunit n=1 Tax=Microbacterium amylolyticum TaxID=936337 RepID=A0ABS4ZGD0_9MICO|nr:ABC transporter permease [Microbacterium amylolyticum]MBP2436277.1 ABC-type transport system involved in multi-copper enzyme maturation permease subunit [Microbacterium amylolyticum]